MTAANVAVSPGVGRTWGRGPFVAVALSIGLLVGIGIGVLALRPAAASQPAAPAVAPTTYQPPVGPMARPPAPVVVSAASALNGYSQLVASLATAESRHDFAAKSRFESQLAAALTAETIGAVYQEHAIWAKALVEAQATGNGYEIFRAMEGMRALCGADAVKAELTFCN